MSPLSDFSAPEPKAQVYYCDHESSVCPSAVAFFTFSPSTLWTELKETWQEGIFQRPLPNLCFLGPIGNTRLLPWPLIGWYTFTSPLEPLNGIQRRFTWSKISTSSTEFVFFEPIGKKMAALASDWLRCFQLLLWNCWTEFNETWQEARSQRRLPRFCFSGRSEKKIAALASYWLRHVSLPFWNRWTEFNDTWQEAESQRLLPKLCFSDRSDQQDGRSGLWLAETFPTSPLKLLNEIQRNLTGSKITTSSTKCVFFMPIWNTRWPHKSLIGWDSLNFSFESAERNSTKLDRKQDLNVIY